MLKLNFDTSDCKKYKVKAIQDNAVYANKLKDNLADSTIQQYKKVISKKNT